MRNDYLPVLATFLACTWIASALAQVEEVVVTGARVSGDDYSRIPAIVLERRADFLVQRIRLTNDTRAEEGRTKELYQTIRDMASDATKRRGIALSYGDEFLIPINSADYEVPLEKGTRRPDTSATELYVKMALRTEFHGDARTSRSLRSTFPTRCSLLDANDASVLALHQCRRTASPR